MIALFFVCMVACIFAGVVLWETEPAATRRLRLGTGLWSWLTSGNWPAKLGGGLLIVGVGALLRYALLRIEVPPESKLVSGGLISAGLFVLARYVRVKFGRREIAVALAGAAFGVAYLTAYSAYAFFHYLEGSSGLIALAIVALGAGAYAMERNAISVALLAMFGAFLAPAFALDQPSVSLFYGYYIAISLLTLLMVALRGWRPLIHLSFLFTLGGGMFFAWTSEFFTPSHFASLQPLLLALIGIHLAMPLAEQRSPRSRWRVRFDAVYFIALPAVGSVLLWLLAPTAVARSESFLLLAGIWSLATVVIRALSLEGALRHGIVAALMAGIGLYLRLPSWPWLLIGQASATLVLLGASRLELDRGVRDVAASGVLVFTGLFTAMSLSTSVTGLPFANTIVAERLLSGALVLLAFFAARRMGHPLSSLIGWLGTIVLINTIALELYRCEIASWPLIVHAALVTLAFAIALVASRKNTSSLGAAALAALLTLSSVVVAKDAHGLVATLLLCATPGALLALAYRRRSEHEVDGGDRVTALILAPFAAWMWMAPSAMDASLPLVCAAGVAMLAMCMARLLRARISPWIDSVLRVYAIAFGAALSVTTLVSIRQGTLPAVFDVLCVAGLVQITYFAERDGRASKGLYVMTTIGCALAIQAMLLRALGPGGTMNVFDVLDLRLPAVLSLFWSTLGAALTIVARRIRSRPLWSLGAMVLVGCAAKLILFDFGSLGELANIIAVIAAGLVFLLVSWLAPVPPKEETEAPLAPTDA